jgi:hypothetical protein
MRKIKEVFGETNKPSQKRFLPIIPLSFSFSPLLPEVEISLCGGLEGENPPFTSLFEQSKVSFDDFVLYLQRADPSLFTNPNLVVRQLTKLLKFSLICSYR